MLHLAEELLRMGLSVTEVIEGYEQACEKAIEILPGNLLSWRFLHYVNSPKTLGSA